MLDVMGRLLTEIRDAPGVAALGITVRVGEFAPGDLTKPFQRIVVLSKLGVLRFRGAPVQEVRVSARCYGQGTTNNPQQAFQDAARVYGAVSDAIHDVGPRLAASGLGIFQSADATGGAASKDPDTGQPYESMVIELYATTQVVTA